MKLQRVRRAGPGIQRGGQRGWQKATPAFTEAEQHRNGVKINIKSNVKQHPQEQGGLGNNLQLSIAGGLWCKWTMAEDEVEIEGDGREGLNVHQKHTGEQC